MAVRHRVGVLDYYLGDLPNVAACECCPTALYLAPSWGVFEGGSRPRPLLTATLKMCLRCELRPATRPPLHVIAIDASPAVIEAAR
jgi:hypothetical protein